MTTKPFAQSFQVYLYICKWNFNFFSKNYIICFKFENILSLNKMTNNNSRKHEWIIENETSHTYRKWKQMILSFNWQNIYLNQKILTKVNRSYLRFFATMLLNMTLNEKTSSLKKDHQKITWQTTPFPCFNKNNLKICILHEEKSTFVSFIPFNHHTSTILLKNLPNMKLKACVRYFHQMLIFSPNDRPSKTMKNAFYFI